MNDVASPPELESVEKRTRSRIKAGRDPRVSRWQGALEAILTGLEDSLLPGEVVTPESLSFKEYEHFQRLQTILDVPPFVYAVFLPPGAADKLNPIDDNQTPRGSSADARKIMVTRVNDFSRILIAEISPSKPGIDILEDASLLGSHNYGNPDECIDDLSKIIWIHFRHKEQWTEPDFIKYTENWFFRCASRKLTDLPVTANFSYIHHPVLIGADIVTAVFTLMKATLNRMCADPEQALRMANEANLYNPGTVEIRGQDLKCGKSEALESLRIHIEDKLMGLLKLLRECDVVNFQGFSKAERRKFKRLFPRTAEQVQGMILERI